MALIAVVGLFSIGRSAGCSGVSTDGQMHFTHFTVAEGEVFRVDAGTEIIAGGSGGRGGHVLWDNTPVGFVERGETLEKTYPLTEMIVKGGNGGNGGDVWAVGSGLPGDGGDGDPPAKADVKERGSPSSAPADIFAAIWQNKAKCLNDGRMLFPDGTVYTLGDSTFWFTGCTERLGIASCLSSADYECQVIDGTGYMVQIGNGTCDTP